MKEGTLVKTDLKFITIGEFTELMLIFSNKDLDNVDKNIRFLSILSDLSVEEIENLDLEVFQDLISKIDITKLDSTSTDFINTIEIDGITYKSRSNGTSFKYNVREITLLKEVIKKNQVNYVLDLASIIFKEEGGSLSPESINHRREIFKDKMVMNTITPYIHILSSYLNEKA